MNAKSLDNSKDGDMFLIVAEDRISHKRVKLHWHFSKDDAISYHPAANEKKSFKYFRVVKEHDIYI